MNPVDFPFCTGFCSRREELQLYRSAISRNIAVIPSLSPCLVGEQGILGEAGSSELGAWTVTLSCWSDESTTHAGPSPGLPL